MFKNLTLNSALKILRKNRGHVIHQDVRIQIMTPAFGTWVYQHGHKFYKNSLSDEQRDILKERRRHRK